MAEVMEQTDMWTTEEIALGTAPAGDITLSMTRLPASALQNRQSIQRVNLPYCVGIAENGFQGASLTNVTAPVLNVVGASAFFNCQYLAEIAMPLLARISGASAFNACYSLRNVNFPSLLFLSSNTFSSCPSLVSVSLPQVRNTHNNTAVGALFQYCRSLKNVSLPEFGQALTTTNFSECNSVQSILLPHVTGITGNNNFQNCYALEKLYAPECMTWANNNFSGCTSLKRLCLYVKPTTLGTTALNAPALEDIYVPWSQGEVSGAPWGAPAGCTVHYNTVYDADGEPIV